MTLKITKYNIKHLFCYIQHIRETSVYDSYSRFAPYIIVKNGGNRVSIKLSIFDIDSYNHILWVSVRIDSIRQS